MEEVSGRTSQEVRIKLACLNVVLLIASRNLRLGWWESSSDIGSLKDPTSNAETTSARSSPRPPKGQAGSDV
ncbi:hypothetical protein [Algoriphagus sp. D3-2-R+10]|uniref:hypothetical protein n=1 Tax=Algoriphagus aurantiacus TaxID=3103948 RepID=UPI002B4089C7|nr:hypothetical protein [Algoriphagus sp. D3-2-R+10]